MGEFNMDPMSSTISQVLQTRGIRDLNDLHLQLYRKELPPTCKEATRPDTALVCATVAPFVCQVSVVQEQHFDAHKVVLFRLSIPVEAKLVTQFPLPRSWID